MWIAVPLLVVPWLLYNIVVLTGLLGGDPSLGADPSLRQAVFSLPMASGVRWNVGVGDMILFLNAGDLFHSALLSKSVVNG